MNEFVPFVATRPIFDELIPGSVTRIGLEKIPTFGGAIGPRFVPDGPIGTFSKLSLHTAICFMPLPTLLFPLKLACLNFIILSTFQVKNLNLILKYSK